MAVHAEDWTTKDGTVYRDVTVRQVDDDAVTINYVDGGALVPLADLSPELQARFHFDPVKATIAAKARVDRVAAAGTYTTASDLVATTSATPTPTPAPKPPDAESSTRPLTDQERDWIQVRIEQVDRAIEAVGQTQTVANSSSPGGQAADSGASMNPVGLLISERDKLEEELRSNSIASNEVVSPPTSSPNGGSSDGHLSKDDLSSH